MKQVLCSKCKKNPAVVFISKVNDTKNEPEGYCIKCAMEMNIGPVKHFMDNMGISADDMDAITEQVNAMLGFDSDDRNLRQRSLTQRPGPAAVGRTATRAKTRSAGSSASTAPT